MVQDSTVIKEATRFYRDEGSNIFLQNAEDHLQDYPV
jgi:hypothetical protein